MRLFAVALIFGLTANSLQAATFSEDILPGIGSDGLIDPTTDSGNLNALDLPPDLLLETAQRNFKEAIDILELELSNRADYASILKLAPQIRDYLPDNARMIWLHALALAATGSQELAEQSLDLEAAADIAGNSPLPLLARAMVDLRAGHPNEAANLVSQAITRAPDDAYAHNLMGIVQSQKGEMEAARDSFAEATRLSSSGVVYWRNLGLSEFALGRIEASAKSIQRALDLNDQDCVSLVALAQVYEAWQRLDDAAQMAQQCLDTENADQRAAAYLIRLQVAQNAFDAALATAAEHADALTDPALVVSEINLLMNRPAKALESLQDAETGPSVQHAFATAMMGDLDTAFEEIRTLSRSTDSYVVALADAALSSARGQQITDKSRQMLQARPDLKAGMAWFEGLRRTQAQGAAAGAAMTQAAAGMLPGVRFEGVPAEDWAAMSIEANPASAALGVLWLLRGYDEAARAAFDHLLANTEVAQIRYFAGLANVRLGDPEQARMHLAHAVGAARGFYAAQVLLGEVQINQGQAAEALASYRKAVEVVEDGGVLMKIGLLADHLGQPDIAEDALRRFIALYPDSFIGYNQLAWVFIQREIRLDEALELAEKANSLQPGNASILDNIGWVHHMQGDTDKALSLLREANRQSGAGNPYILYHLAVVEAESGSLQNSRRLLDRFLKIAPENHAVQARAVELRQKLQ